jgi:prohibitin 2
LTPVLLGNFSFSKSFNEAIEAKTTAEQLKLKAERDCSASASRPTSAWRAQRPRQKALAVQKQQVTAELLRLREVENQRRAIERWDGRLPTYVASGSLPFLQLGGQAK